MTETVSVCVSPVCDRWTLILWVSPSSLSWVEGCSWMRRLFYDVFCNGELKADMRESTLEHKQMERYVECPTAKFQTGHRL